jgi:hypothetical protein
VSGWTLAEYEGEDGAYMVRALSTLPDAAERTRYPVAVRVSWPWGPIASEAEEDAVLDRMIRWENVVHAAGEAGGWGMLVAVVTNGWGREWLFHAASADEFRGELRGATEGEDAPVTLAAFDDPTWKAARELSPRAAMH